MVFNRSLYEKFMGRIYLKNNNFLVVWNNSIFILVVYFEKSF